MIDDFDIHEDFAAIVEPVLDVDDMIYLEQDWEYYFKEAN